MINIDDNLKKILLIHILICAFIYNYKPSKDRCEMLDSLFDYMINNVDLLELLEEISLYNLFEEKTYFGEFDSYLKNNHLQNKTNMEKLISDFVLKVF